MRRKSMAVLTAMVISAAAAVCQGSLTAQAEVVQEQAVLYGAATDAATEKDKDGVSNANGEYVSDNGFGYTIDANGTTVTIRHYYGTATA